MAARHIFTFLRVVYVTIIKYILVRGKTFTGKQKKNILEKENMNILEKENMNID